MEYYLKPSQFKQTSMDTDLCFVCPFNQRPMKLKYLNPLVLQLSQPIQRNKHGKTSMYCLPP